MALTINLRAFKRFFRSQSIGGVILIMCVTVSLIIANTPAGQLFEILLGAEIGTEKGDLRYPVSIWINDGLMAVFFLLIGLEIKRELLEGELSTFKKATLPVFAAIGGAIIPAVIFAVLNQGTATSGGWGIPMATDIAFALGVIALLGDKVPPSLKIFLAALAIVDDLIAILVIAVFYSEDLHYVNLLYAAGLLGLLAVVNWFRVRSLWAYLVPGLFIWYFIHHSGIHATIAGVLTAFTLPTNVGRNQSPLERLEHKLSAPVNFLIMPIFAIANTNINFQEASSDMLTGKLGLGIIIGLIVGKPVGIALFSWLAVKLKMSSLPGRARWKHIFGVGMLGGIGFTMSIFIALLSFKDVVFQSSAKVAILLASLVSGICGIVYLYFVGKADLAKAKASSPPAG